MPRKDFQAAFIIAQLDPLRALPILRVPGTGREPELNERQLHARRRVHKAMEALGGICSPAGSCVWHVVGLQRSVREWAMRQGWGGRPVRQEQAQGILVAALGMLAAHSGTVRPSGPPEGCCATLDDRFRIEEQKSEGATVTAARGPKAAVEQGAHCS